MSTTDIKYEIPLTPSVLRWARETAGVSINEVVQRLKRKTITTEVIEGWERGEGSPSYSQLESLAYDVYRRPLAIFFFPSPPEEKTPKQSFRTLPDQEINKISPRLRYLLRQAQVRQIYLEELFENVHPPKKNILYDFQISPEKSLDEIISKVREYFNISLDKQISWINADDAFKHWRDAFENHGIYIFKEAFKEENVSGFCLFDEKFPIIYVNNSKPHTRQIFTLFHELAHLLYRTGGIDKPIEEYIKYLNYEDKRIEIFCNQFAGEFLVPNTDFNQRLAKVSAINEQVIEYFSKIYHVSREVILRKLYDRNLISQADYQQNVDKWVEQYKKINKNQKGGGNYYLTQGVYLSRRYIELAFTKLYQNKISVEKLAEYLGVKAKNISSLENSLTQHRVPE